VVASTKLVTSFIFANGAGIFLTPTTIVSPAQRQGRVTTLQLTRSQSKMEKGTTGHPADRDRDRGLPGKPKRRRPDGSIDDSEEGEETTDETTDETAEGTETTTPPATV
jgi:hypothetical protein